LKDDQYEVRRGAVDLLGLLAKQQPDIADAVQTALKQTLKDRDKAVVEAARNVNSQLDALANGAKTDELITKAKAALQAKDLGMAAKLLDEAGKLGVYENNDKIAKLRAII